MANKSSNRYLRTKRLIEARLSDPEQGRIEEECFVREILDPADSDLEAALVTTAYLDYRYKTPYERTQEFAQAYEKWYAIKQKNSRGRVGRRVDKERLSMWKDGYITMFWRARQHADALGMPYDRYIIAAMNRAIEIGTTKLPAPNQLYDDEVVVHVSKELDALRKAGTVPLLPRDCNPRFFAENYVGDPVQVAALDAIEAEVRLTGGAGRASKLSRYMRELRLISETEARSRLGDALVDAALGERLLNAVRPDQRIADDVSAVPGCFGHHSLLAGTMCGTCPVAAACMERRTKVLDIVQERHGTTDVKALRVRDNNRKRKQRERDRKRAGMAMTLQEQNRLLREAGDPKVKAKRLKAKERRDAKKQRDTGKEGKSGIGPEVKG